jgi:SAM-dependent methyltransferase
MRIPSLRDFQVYIEYWSDIYHMDYQQVIANLQLAYSRESASGRDQVGKEDWKVAERQQFLDLLKREGKKTLLEIGAGTGTDGLFFQKSGMRVVCTDLSPAMIELCREKAWKPMSWIF